MTTVIEPGADMGAAVRARAKLASDLCVNDLVTNLGVVISVRRDGVFVTAALRGTVWSPTTGTGDVATIDVSWHEANLVAVENL